MRPDEELMPAPLFAMSSVSKTFGATLALDNVSFAVERGEHRKIVRACLSRLSHGEVDPYARAGDLPIAIQQQVEIARALASDARVIVFDEPTSSLGREDAQHLFAVIRELRAQGISIVYISHFLEETAEVSDTFTVLRDGRVAAEGRMSGTSLDLLVRHMV